MGNYMKPKQTSGEFGATEFESVIAVIRDYFDGLYFADVAKLKTIFHADAFLKAPGLRRSLNQWLEDVGNRPVPEKLGQPFNFKLLSVEIIKDQAMVKLECPIFDHFYIDYLGLLKENGRWLIVNKMYSDLEENLS